MAPEKKNVEVIPVHAIKAYVGRGGGGCVYFFITPAVDGGQEVNCHLHLLTASLIAPGKAVPVHIG